jgi:hypothetical protein
MVFLHLVTKTCETENTVKRHYYAREKIMQIQLASQEIYAHSSISCLVMYMHGAIKIEQT